MSLPSPPASTFKDGQSAVFTTSVCLGENPPGAEEAARVGHLPALPPSVIEALIRPTHKGEAAPTIPKAVNAKGVKSSSLRKKRSMAAQPFSTPPSLYG